MFISTTISSSHQMFKQCRSRTDTVDLNSGSRDERSHKFGQSGIQLLIPF